ncbi:uncharacterized protein M6B38_261660 [Iris pallida]|uniref:Transmembrane protein n=1 Tax=Iris pallida TaxID=29817 RepID=A0AAX6IDD2_IRIPA|nr:uncharacterized protein M6B38_261660 [Iris pallida]
MTTGSDVAKVEEGANRRIWMAAEDTTVHGGVLVLGVLWSYSQWSGCTVLWWWRSLERREGWRRWWCFGCLYLGGGLVWLLWWLMELGRDLVARAMVMALGGAE